MDKIHKIKINETEYHYSDDILALKMKNFDKCINGRRLIDDFNIKKPNFIYAAFKDGEWIKTDGRSRKFDKVFVKVSWFENYIQENDSDDDCSENDSDGDCSENDSDCELYNEKIINAPGIIKLTKKEKIKDNDGNIIEIEVRGTRDPENIFFRVSDVTNGFDMPNLYKSITKKNRGYHQNIHYRYFFIDKRDNDGKNKKIKNKKALPKKLFLTYEGLLRVMFVSRNERVSKFIMWATKTLFTVHLGTKEQKSILCSKLMGITADVVKEVFNKTSSTLPVCYLFTIGKVKDLRATLNLNSKYDDESIVAKIGESIDLKRRIDEHTESFRKIPGTNLCLRWYNYIDPQFTTKAEAELKDIFNKLGYIIEHPEHKEIIVYSKQDAKTVINQFDSICKKYIGHISEISNKLKDLNNEIENLKLLHKVEISELKSKLKDKENIIKQQEYEKKIYELETQNKIMSKDKTIKNLNNTIKSQTKSIDKLNKKINEQTKEITSLKKKLRK